MENIRKTRLATVGTSWIAEAFVKAAKTSGRFELAAVYSRSIGKAGNIADNWGALLYFNSLEEMAQSDGIDAVYIASPNSLHFTQSKLFLQHNKHVICEKPATVTPQELAELIEIAEKNNLIYMEAIIPRYLKETEIIRQHMSELGDISGAALNFLQYSSKYPSYLAGELPNIFNPKFCTGSLMDLGVYNVYMAHILFGKPKSVTASAAFMESGADKSGADKSGAAILKYDGFDVTLNYSKISATTLKSEIRGENAVLSFDSVSRPQHIELLKQKTMDKLFEHRINTEHFESMIPEAVSFYEKITGKTPQEQKDADTALMLDVAETMELIRKSAGIKFDN